MKKKIGISKHMYENNVLTVNKLKVIVRGILIFVWSFSFYLSLFIDFLTSFIELNVTAFSYDLF